jgi:Mg2+ and Co2+ transporter CorA
MCSRRPSRYWPSDSTRRGWPDEDRRQRNQRPKCELYDGYAFVVLFALTWAGEEPEANEIHSFLTPRRLITVEDRDSPAMDAV